MKICFISNEIFAFGKYGGFGRATRIVGRELAKLGHEITAVIPRRGTQKKVEELDGIKVLGYEINNPFTAIALLKQADADIYHSEEPSFISYLAQQVMPDRKHVITFRDTRDTNDWWIEFKQPSTTRLQVLKNILFEDSIFSQFAVHRAHAVGAAARFLVDKAQKKYHLKQPPLFLPTPVGMPDETCKSETPLVVFVSRLDHRKRPELFMELASHFPDVQFAVVGRSQNPGFEKFLNEKYAHLPNLKFRSFINQFVDKEFSSLFCGAWILVNTSQREGLPNAFLEAAAHRCAILSTVNPDDFPTNFGVCVENDDYVSGLRTLLENDLWMKKGAAGHEYVKQYFAIPKAIQAHLDFYQGLFKHA